MKNYLIIAEKIDDVVATWNAIIIERSNNPLFELYLKQFESATILTTETLMSTASNTKGVIIAETIEEIEPTMRNIFGFRKCDTCGAWISPQDVRVGGTSVYLRSEDKRYCKTCWEIKEGLAPKKLELNNYHGTSHLARVINGDGETFDLTNVLGIGIEMEYNHGRGHDTEMKCTEEFYNEAKPRSRNRLWRVEHDGTVSGEIISNVFTKKSLLAYKWETLTNELKFLGNDESKNCVGFHVHFSKTWLGTSPKEQALNFLKLHYFLKSYEADWLKVSGRRGGSDMSYCNFLGFPAIERIKQAIINCPDNENPWNNYSIPTCHDSCLISSGPTIEIRFGKSTNDPVRILNYLKLLLGIVENIKNVPFNKCYCFSKVLRNVPQDVLNYWRLKGAFIRTNAIENRGETL